MSSFCGSIGFPLRVTLSVSGSSLVPSSVTGFPLIVTAPCSIRSSALRRLTVPLWARNLFRRIRFGLVLFIWFGGSGRGRSFVCVRFFGSAWGVDDAV